MTWSSRARQPASRISAFVHGAADDDTRDSVTHLPNELLAAVAVSSSCHERLATSVVRSCGWEHPRPQQFAIWPGTQETARPEIAPEKPANRESTR